MSGFAWKTERSAYLGQYSPRTAIGGSWGAAAPFRLDTRAPCESNPTSPCLACFIHLYYQVLLQSLGCTRASPLLWPLAIHWLSGTFHDAATLLSEFSVQKGLGSEGLQYRLMSGPAPREFLGRFYMLLPGWPSTTISLSVHHLFTFSNSRQIDGCISFRGISPGSTWRSVQTQRISGDIRSQSPESSSFLVGSSCAYVSLLSLIMSAGTEFTRYP